jgi:hypothetical protein
MSSICRKIGEDVSHQLCHPQGTCRNPSEDCLSQTKRITGCFLCIGGSCCATVGGYSGSVLTAGAITSGCWSIGIIGSVALLISKALSHFLRPEQIQYAPKSKEEG